MEPKFYKFCKYFTIACCLVGILAFHEASARSKQPSQSPRTQASTSKFDIFKTTNDVLVLLPPGITDSQAKNRSIKLSGDAIFNQKTRMETYGDFGFDEQVDIEPRSGARESRRVNLLRGLWNKPRISPLYLVNGTVCRFVNSAPICTTLTTTGIMPAGNNTSVLPAFSRGGLDQFVQFPTNQQFSNNQQLPNNQQQQQFQNTNNQQQQFPNNQQQQFSNNQPQINNQQQSRPNIG